VAPNKRYATPLGAIWEPTLREGVIVPQDGVALSLMYRWYTTLSAPGPAKKMADVDAYPHSVNGR